MHRRAVSLRCAYVSRVRLLLCFTRALASRAVTQAAVRFYLSQRFSPSPEILKMRKLYDGRREHVRESTTAFLRWDKNDFFDEALAEKIRKKFAL